MTEANCTCGSKHTRILAILFGVLGVVSFLISVGLLLMILIPKPNEDPEITRFLNGVLAVFGVLGLVMSVPSLLGSWALLNDKRWASTYSLVLCVLFLFNLPLGTAVGVYGLWALTRPETEGRLPGVEANGSTDFRASRSPVRRGSASIGLLKAVLVTLVGTTLLAGGVIYGGTGPSSIGVVMVCLLAGAGGSILAFVVSSVNGTDAPPSKVLRAHLFALVGFLVTYILSIAVWALTGSETAAIIGAIAALLLILLAVSSSVVVVFRLLLNKPAPRI